MTFHVQDVYQTDNLACIRAEWARGHKYVLYCLPTGGGKSVVVRRDVADTDAAGINQVVIAHRQELVAQMSEHVASMGVYHRIIAPANVISGIVAMHRKKFGRSFVKPDARCAVAGIDTLKARQKQLAEWAKQIGKWTIDEAHHVLRENKWGLVATMFPNAIGLGVTASPQRADGMGLGRGYKDAKGKWTNDGLFDVMVLGPTMRQLIDMGALTEYEMCLPTSDLDRDTLTVGASGDFTQASLIEASEKSHIVGDVVAHYCQHAWGKRTIVFATDVATAHKMAARFKLFGIKAEAIDGTTDDTIRRDFVDRFRDGRLTILINVDLFGEGFDVPAVECVIMARPTNSLSVYLQQFGRALRLMAGKTRGLVIDMVSNWKQHGFPDKARNWSLERRERRGSTKPADPDDMPLTRCLNIACLKPFERIHRTCPHCGTPVPVIGAGGGGVRDIKQVDGDLMLLDADVLARMRGDTVLPEPWQVGGISSGIQNLNANKMVEKRAAQKALQDALDLWAGQRIAAGDTTDQAYRRFYLATGQTVLDVQNASFTKADYDTTRDMVLSWL